MAFEAEIPLIIGLVGVAIAVLERSYKAYLEAKKIDPSISFGAPYLINLLISTGVGTALATIIPNLVTQVTEQTGLPLTVGGMLLNIILGYTVTYRILDGLNTSTDRKLAIAEIETPQTTTPTPPPPPSP
jgi:hypothetical protein